MKHCYHCETEWFDSMDEPMPNCWQCGRPGMVIVSSSRSTVGWHSEANFRISNYDETFS